MQRITTSFAALVAGLVLIAGCEGNHPAAPSAGADPGRVGVRANHIERLGSCWPNDQAARLLATGNWEISPNIIFCAEGYTPIRVARG